MAMIEPNTLVLKVYDCPSEIAEACKVARKARLFVGGWNMLKSYKAPHHVRRMAVAFIDGKPVGCCLSTNRFCVLRTGYDIETFVKKAYRLRGIGKALYAEIYTDEEEHYGIQGSRIFYKKAHDYKVSLKK
jgi:GNAT superfamily N-acetyltransferase